MRKLVKCKSCGAEIAENVRACPQCGAKRNVSVLKRWWFWVIVVVLFFAFSSGDSDGGSSSGQGPDNPSLSSTVGSDGTNAPSSSHTEPTAVSTNDVTIEESVLYDEDGIRITVTGMKDTFTGVDIKLLIENNTEENIAVGCSDFVVNGITIDGYMHIQVAANKKANGAISFYNSNLASAGIEQIATIDTFDAYISNTDTYRKTRRISLSIATTLTDYVQAVDDSGNVLFSDGGITVIAKSLSKDFIGGTITVLVKNESGQDIRVHADNVSVNGYTISVLHSESIADGTVRFCEIDLLETYLDENGIDEIEEATFGLSIIDPSTYQTILETGELKLTISE